MRQQPRRWAKTGESLVRLRHDILRLQRWSIPICDGTANIWDKLATIGIKRLATKKHKKLKMVIH
jgi:hypothetical protein